MEKPEIRSFGKIKVKLSQKNIADCEADGIVNAANAGLWMGGGVAGALCSKGGIEIQQEAIKHKSGKLGEVIVTGAGKLAAKYVLHAVVIDDLFMKGTSIGTVIVALENILKKSLEMKLNSLAIPFLGTGVGKLHLENVVGETLRTIEKISRRYPRNLDLELAIRDREEFKTAKEVFSSYKGLRAEQKEINELAQKLLNEMEKE